MIRNNPTKLQCRARRRVGLALVMCLFDEGVVGLEILKQSSRELRNTKKDLRAHREVGSVNQSAIVFGNDALNFRQFVQPGGGTDDQRYPGDGRRLGIFRY